MTMKLTDPNLIEVIENLIEYVNTYESDTFSASANGLTKQQATKLVEIMLIDSVQDLEKNLDGIQLTENYELFE